MQANTTRKLSDNSLSWSIFYFVLGATWILSSDLWVYHHGGNLQAAVQSIIKGLAYVFVTSVVLYAMMRQNSSSTRKLAQKLQKSESRLRRVFDTADEGLIIFDPEFKIEALNSRMAAMLLRAPSELVGVPIERVFDGD